MEYKNTLNLPVTDFPMKANLPQREPEILAGWQKSDLYGKLAAAGKEKPRYVLHDGPPYANGHIHIGHALNKILKDIILKSKRMQGFDAPYVPGWDCHGLPIELQVEKNLGSKKHETTKLQMRKQCREYAGKFVKIQRDEFERLGVLGDWDRPYLTMTHDYEGITARELARFADNGGLYKGKKPVHWCSSCVTALAEAEVEYADKTSPSIYVKFLLQDDISASVPVLAGKKVSLVIWTTTPWTIPANLAVALHPELEYVALETGGEVLVVAEGLKDAFMAATGVQGSVVATFRADILYRKRCRHPFYDRDSIVLLGEHVTLDAGTGCVHTAPGHGQEDYELALVEGLDIYNPVDNRGRYIQSLEFFGGQFVFDANASVIEKLQEVGALVGQGSVEHSYPHCWRCKKPIIFRATEQWFISMEKNDLRKKALEEIDRVSWVPKWGRERIHGMIENRPDWCISRQRSWGVPITAFYCTECGEILADGKTMHHVADLFMEGGADLWYEKDAAELLPPGTVCPQCGKSAFEKEMDILDVWFDSGVSHAAVLENRPELGSPANMYLEGSDQHRGWFHSSLLASVGTRGTAPYKEVLTHGFVVDGSGRKMSKSVGNVVAPEEVIKKYGAEILRLWVAAQDYRDDVRISQEILTRLAEAYRRIRNTCRYLLGNLYDFDPATDMVPFGEMTELDRWALHQLEVLKEKVFTAYNEYEFHILYHAVNGFCTVEMSSFYLDIIKERYTSRKDAPERRSAQTVMYLVLESLVRLMAPVLSFTADEVWGYMPKRAEASIHLTSFPEPCPERKDEALVERWARIMAVRGEVSKALEQARVQKTIGHSLDAAVTLAAEPELLAFLKEYAGELATVFIVSRVNLVEEIAGGFVEADGVKGLKIGVAGAPGEKCERCWHYDEEIGGDAEHPTLCPKCVAAVR
ncbi:isoleucine--tRNA ligase [Geobacter hydrogenophilus]|uniref:Isoleucine--tRNA ligase n=1 Tax=Geobacter hydrogenophilus TaxID=40983 RepID=A0A9W6G080_9BACT|nr:isoleucine--tRNA ligase [Geobacter hydrogenophilus]MBT0894323.1 isoleucine--tRNA ligase [Geobacter hydrogenophilus]GLI38390.1 isoleucine--tRNA ligase [Geobacter hydrogenophilus]